MNQNSFTKQAQRMRNAAEKAARAAGCSIEDAEDVASEVMLTLWEIRGRLNEASCTAYASVVARHKALRMLREKSPTVSIDDYSPPDILIPSPEDDAVTGEEVDWLLSLIDTLPSTQQSILELRQVEMLSKAEIAQRLGITESSVSTLLARARRTMYNNIKQRF